MAGAEGNEGQRDEFPVVTLRSQLRKLKCFRFVITL
jgi:hypothetical protein